MSVLRLILLYLLLFQFNTNATAQAIGDYRSAGTGAWNVATTWQTWNGSAWVATATIPSTTSGVITIMSPHVVSLTATISIDQCVVNSGATLMSTGGTITIGNGAISGVQLQIDGTFHDANATSVAFAAGAKWQLGTTGTFIKNSASAIAIWHTSYQGGGGMSAIPATSNWIVRRTAAAIPSFSNVGITYGNLTFENTNATTLNISAAGSTGFMTVKGNLDIGGSGTTGVVVTNPNTNLSQTQVLGNMIVRSSRTYTGSGTGITIAGTLTVNGTFNNNNATVTTVQGATTITGTFNNNGTSTTNLQGGTSVNGTFTNTATATSNLSGTTNINNTYSNIGITNVQGALLVNGNLTYTGSTSQLNFTGGNSQIVSGAGTLQLRNSTINKSSNDVILNRPITIDNLLTLTQGKIFTTATNLLTVGNYGSVVVSSPSTNNSFVSGPIRKDNTSAGFSFPVGKGSNYQPLTISATSGSFGAFWTEDFGTATCSAQNNRVINHINVATGLTWTETINADGGAGNLFFVSPTEAGMGVGACGDGCLSNPSLTNQTLHIGNQSISPVACFVCPTGDCGAAYDASPISGICSPEASPISDRIAESPVINCTGHSNIQLSFNYLEGGQGVTDNGLVWYYDGTTWTLLSDMNKTPSNCGGASTWTAFTIALPISANNNPNVKIGFQWVNNEDNVGTDPSLAIDDIALSEAAPAESFTCEYFPSNPITNFGSAKEATIDGISTIEYWILDRNIGTVSKQVSLTWDSPSAITTPASTKVIRWDGSMWRDHTNGGTAGVASNDPSCTTQSACGSIVSGTIVSNFSPFTFGIPDVPLPAELVAFDAKLSFDKGQINWTTASERNTDYFQIEKSTDGVNFSLLAVKKAAGNSTTVLNYQLFDDNLADGINYYRLKTVDVDGKFVYSSIASLNYMQIITIYPNPVKSIVSVEFESTNYENTSVELTSIFGYVLLKENMTKGLLELDMSGFASGVYFVNVIKDGSIVALKRVVKE
ncbi:MAG: hypothetical protein RI922_688 [Bacteroidota bacterium]|jgi:hypothetical protein